METKINDLYTEIESYADTARLFSLSRALPFIRELMEEQSNNFVSGSRYQNELCHALEVCMMLIDLHLNISRREEDILLSAVILHIYPENFPTVNVHEVLVEGQGFSEAIYQIIDIIVPRLDMREEELTAFYSRIQENKLALLAALADRGNIVQQLYRFSTWNAHRYIEETKACYYPMCIYGKEHYHNLLAPISVLMEKIKSLLEVAEILLRRYEVREAELLQDIQAIREENATIKGIIAKFREGQKE